MRRKLSFSLGAVVLLVSMAACGSEPAATSTTETETPATTAQSTTTSSGVATTPATETTTTTRPSVDGDLLVVGDWGSGTLPQGAVAGAMMRYAEANAVEAVLTTGDNFYSDDWEFLMEPYGWVAEMEIPFWVAWGNHDLDTDARVAGMGEAFDDPPRWDVRQWGAVDVVILDSTQVESEEQLAFVADALADDTPAILVIHHPVYSCGSHGATAEITESWVPLFDEDVFMVLSGHEHNYQRFEDDGISYVVTGGGGAALTEIDDCSAESPEAEVAESIHHFVVLEQDDNVSGTAYDVNGNVIDEFELPLP